MRQPKSSLLLILLALCTLTFATNHAWADARSDARTHYISGQKAYAASDYRGAIKEFSAAQELAPADLNNYNLALCYDKLGDADNAITYYRQYLDKVPDAPKRSEIEASMARLDGALKSAQTKKADEAKKAQADADAAKKAQADADAAKKAQADADAAKHNVIAPPPVPVTVGGGPDTTGAGPAMTGVGSTGTPSSGLAVSTGDAQLDRVQGINIDQIRDQRMGGAASGMPADPRMGPTGPTVPMGPNTANAQPNGMAAMNGQQTMQNPNGGQQPGPEKPSTPPAETPVYKKWWFWVVVAVSAYVVYEIATQSSTSSPVTGRDSTMFGKSNAGYGQTPSSSGFTLHF